MRIINFTFLLLFFCFTVIAQDKDKDRDWKDRNVSVTHHQLNWGPKS